MPPKKIETPSTGDNYFPEKKPFHPVVCISVPGIDIFSLKNFLLELPASLQHATIVIAGDTSLLTTKESPALLLANDVSLTVKKLKHNTLISEAGIYIAPNNKTIAFTTHGVQLGKPVAGTAATTIVEGMLESLAILHGNGAAAIILSANTSVFPAALQSIKNVGGLAIAYNEASAKDNTPMFSVYTGNKKTTISGAGKLAGIIEHFLLQQHFHVPANGSRQPGKKGTITKPESLAETNNHDAAKEIEALRQELKRKDELLSKAERYLLASHQKYIAVINKWDQAFLLLDATGQVKEANQAACNMFGYSADEFKKLTRPQFLHYAVHQTQSQASTHQSGKATGLKKTGESFGCEFSSDVLKELDGSGITAITIKQLAVSLQEEEINKNQQLLKLAESISQMGSWKLNLLTNKMVWSDDLFRLFGCQPGDFEPTQEIKLSFVHPDDRDHVTQIYKQVLETGGEYLFEKRIILPTGNMRRILSKGMVEKDENGVPQELAGIFKDITTEKQLREHLEQSVAYFKGAFDNSAIGMALIGIDGSWKEVNQSTCNILGYSREELNKLTFQDITYPDDLDLDLEYLAELVADKRQSYQMEKRYFHKNGHIIWVLLVVSMVKDQEGKVLHFISQIEDITERKQNEIDLRKREQQYKSLFEQNSAAVFSVDMVGRITSANKVLLSKTQATIEQITGMHFREFAHPDDLAETNEAFEIVKTGKATEIKIRVYSLTGDLMHIILILLPVIINNNINSVYAIAHDVTTDYQAERELKKVVGDLNKVMQASFDIICTIDTDGKFVLVSSAAERILGYTPAELAGKSFMDLVYPEDIAVSKAVFLELMQGVTQSDFENRYIKKDGSIVCLAWSGRYDEGDQLVHCIARDATPMKMAASENLRLSYVLQKSLNEIYIFDATSFMLEYANEGALQNLGYATAAIKGLTIHDINPVIGPEELRSLAAPLLNKQKDKLVFETIFERADTSRYFAEVHLQITHYNNKPGFLAFVQDISERVQASQEKEFERKNKEALINSTGDMMWSMDKDFRLITANRAFLTVIQTVSGKPLRRGDCILSVENLNPVKKAHWVELCKRAFTGEAFNVEIFSPATDSTKASWSEINFNPILDGEAIMGIAIYSRNITENKLNLQKLQDSEQRFRSLIENSADMLTLINSAGAIEYISPAVERVFGYTAKRSRPVDAIEIIHPADLDLAQRFLHESFQNPGIPVPILFRNRRKNGSYIWVEGTVTNMLDIPGVHAIVANFRDITDRKKIEDELQLSEEKYKLLFYSNPLPVWIYDIDTVEILDVNESATNHYGYSRAECLQMTFSAVFVQPLTIQPDASRKAAYLQKNTLRFGVTEHRKKNGEHIKVEVSSHPIRYNGRNAMIVVCNDVTEKQAIEEALRLSNERYNYVTRASFDAIWDWDIQKNTLYWGEGYQTFFGYETDRLAADKGTWATNIHPEDHQDIQQRLSTLINGSGTIWSAEYRYLKANGDYAFVADKGLVIRDAQGRGIRMIGAMHDITREKNEEQQLRLFESVITNTNDGVVITDSSPLDEPGPKIVYVNDAFTKMTGYTRQEVIGKTPRILQGPKSDKQALARLRNSIEKRETCEIETINYKKNGEEFWVNFSIVPMVDDKGWFSHWIAITRDITQRKRQDAEKEVFFNLVQSLGKLELGAAWIQMLKNICRYAGFAYAEAWMVNMDRSEIMLQRRWTQEATIKDLFSNDHITRIKKGEGLTGMAWTTNQVTYVNDITNVPAYLSKKFAADSGINSAAFIPLFFKGQVIGLLSLYSFATVIDNSGFRNLFDTISQQLGPYVQNKRAEDELARFFNLSPDFLAIAGTDGYFKKINPAVSRILGYTSEELFSRPISDFTHPDDRAITDQKRKKLGEGTPLLNFENRYLTKSGETRWFSWTSTPLPEEGLIFAVAKDTTEKKKLDEERKRILESISDFFFALDKNFNFTYMNSATEQLFRIAPGKLIGKNIWQAKPSLKDSVFYEKAQQAISSREPVSFEWYDEYADSWFEESLYPSEDGLSVFFRSINDRKAAEQALKEAFREKDTILESIGDAFFALDKKWTVTYWNKMSEQLLKVEREDIVGKNLWETLSASLPYSFYINYHKAIRDNEAIHFEEYYVPLKIWLEVSAYPSHEGLSVYFKDISVRKEAEDAIRTSNERYDMVAKATNDNIWDWDLITNQVIRPGKRLETLFGYESVEAAEVDAFWNTHAHPEDWEKVNAKRKLLFQNPAESYWEDEYRFLASNGEYGYVYDKGYIIRNQAGNAIRMIGASQDITKEKMQVNEIIRIQQNLDSLINNTSDLIWSIDTNFNIITANKAFYNLLQTITGQEVLEGDYIIPLMGEITDGLKWKDLYNKALAGETFDIEESFHAAGSTVPHYNIVSFSPIVSKNGRISGIACFAKDVTELKQAGEKLKELNSSLEKRAEELVTSNSELERFAYVASHDLQEPLRMVSSFLQLLQRRYGEKLDDTARKYIHFSVDGADRMKRLINDLLQYSRVGTASLEIVPVNMNEVLDDVLLLFRNEVNTIDAEIIVQDLPVIYAGRSAMSQLMQNLVGNALKYRSVQRPEVVISAKEEETEWVFTVKDNGIGIDAKFRDKIFIIFQRLHNKDEFNGTGIGLAICKKIIERYQGKIWVESEFGKGSKFIFAIPKRNI